MSIRAKAVHGVVCARDEGPENYFGWPSVAVLADGTLVAGASGLRRGHICPWGKTTLFFSRDNGATWNGPDIVHNDLIDNRDAGVIAMGGQKFAVTWFSTDTRQYDLSHTGYAAEADAYYKTWNEDTVATLTGSWMKITGDGGQTWTRPINVPVSTPHGFTCLKDGRLGYLGKGFDATRKITSGPLQYCISEDSGLHWHIVGEVPIPAGEEIDRYHEPHVLELTDGSLLGVIRYHVPTGGLDTCITRSRNGGVTWDEPVQMHVEGSPPHLLRHSSGAIIMTYGYRNPGYGQRAVISHDEGVTWSEEIILRDDGESGDLGYPCSVELPNGDVLTVYYQALPGRKNTSIQWTRWKIDDI